MACAPEKTQVFSFSRAVRSSSLELSGCGTHQPPSASPETLFRRQGGVRARGPYRWPPNIVSGRVVNTRIFFSEPHRKFRLGPFGAADPVLLHFDDARRPVEIF